MYQLIFFFPVALEHYYIVILSQKAGEDDILLEAHKEMAGKVIFSLPESYLNFLTNHHKYSNGLLSHFVCLYRSI